MGVDPQEDRLPFTGVSQQINKETVELPRTETWR